MSRFDWYMMSGHILLGLLVLASATGLLSQWVGIVIGIVIAAYGLTGGIVVTLRARAIRKILAESQEIAESHQ
jgi:hypothetical protein